MKQFLLALTSCILFLTSCKKEDPVVVINVADEFNVNLIEFLTPDENQLALQLTTIENQPCQNTEIFSTIAILPNSVKIAIQEIHEPDACIQGDVQIHSIIPFPAPENSMNIKLELANAIVNNGQITFSDDQYALEFETQDGIKVERKLLNKVPKGILWGYIGTNNIQIVSSFEQFITYLNGVSTNPSLQSGDYGHYAINTDQVIESINDDRILDHENLFLRKLDIPLQELKVKVAEFRTQYGTDLMIKIMTADGEVI